MRRAKSNKDERTKFEDFVAGKTGAQLDVVFEHKLPLLHVSVGRSDFHQALTLLKRGADPNVEGGALEETPLHLVFRQMREGLGGAVEPGLPPMGMGDRRGGRARLMMEGEYGIGQMVELLLAYGADLSNQDLEGRTPLQVALQGLTAEEASAHMPLIKSLVVRGGAAEGFGMDEETVQSVLGIESSVAEWCEELKAQFQDAHMQLLAAAEDGSVKDILELLRQRDPLILANDPDYDGHTALHFAVRKNQTPAVRCLLERFANPNFRARAAVPVLYMACSAVPAAEELQHKLAIIQLLVEAADGVDLPCAAGTALQAACQCGFLTAAWLLLSALPEADRPAEEVASWVQGGAEAVKAAWDAYEEGCRAAEAAAAEAAAQEEQAAKLSLEKEMLRKKLTEQGFSKREIGEALSAGVEIGLDGMIDRIRSKRAALKAERQAAEEARIAQEAAEAEEEAQEGTEEELSDDSEFDAWDSEGSSDGWGSDPDDDDGDPAESATLSRLGSIVPTSVEELQDTREKRILRAQETLCISTALVAVLLPKYKWDQDALVQAWYNSSNPEELLEKCGLVLEEPREMECPADSDCPLGGAEDCVTYEFEEPPEDNAEHYTMLACGHPICLPCWRAVITGEIDENRVVPIRCPMCIACGDPSPAVPESMIKRLVSEETYIKYQRFVLQSFVVNTPAIRWCPSPGCNYAVDATNSLRLASSKKRDNTKQECFQVECVDGHCFCFWCSFLGGQGHKPVTCANMKDWDKRSVDEGGNASMAWIESNTKLCPNCGNPVEKNGGCNHIKCGSGGPYDNSCSTGGCGHHFCWACLGPMEGHTDFFNCDKKAREINMAELAKKDKSKAELLRYLGCWKAWKEHDTDAKQLRDMEPMLDTKCTQILDSGCVNAFNISEGIKEAVQVLHNCRCFLKNFEIAMFYFEPGSVDEELFQRYVVSMKQVVLKLSTILQKPPMDITLPELADSIALAQAVFAKFN